MPHPTPDAESSDSPQTARTRSLLPPERSCGAGRAGADPGYPDAAARARGRGDRRGGGDQQQGQPPWSSARRSFGSWRVVPSGGCTGERGGDPGRGRGLGSEEDAHSHLGADGQLDRRYPWVGGHPSVQFSPSVSDGAALPGLVSSIIFLRPTPYQALFFSLGLYIPLVWVSDCLPRFWVSVHLSSLCLLSLDLCSFSLGLCFILSLSLCPALWPLLSLVLYNPSV